MQSKADFEKNPKPFKPGFLSSLNRSFRLKSSFPADRTKRLSENTIQEDYDFLDNSFDLSHNGDIHQPAYDSDFHPRTTFVMMEQPLKNNSAGDQALGNFRRCHSINANRKHRLVKIPEMPLGSDLLKRVWSDGLDAMPNTKEGDAEMSKPLCNEIATPRIDSYRFSMANLEDSQEVDLDAILTELCALETKCNEEIRRNSFPLNISNSGKPPQIDALNTNCGHQNIIHHGVPLQRTDSPDNDSAFSDTVSMLSSESSTSSGTSFANKSHVHSTSLHQPKDAAFLAKAEKIRLALEKMKKASVKKLFIKAFSIDGSSKSLLVDEKMTCAYVTRLLAEKNHVPMDPKWALIEYLPELHMERIFEDHEILVDNLMLWARDSKNKIFFVERPEKMSLFHFPEKYLINDNNRDRQSDYDEHSRTLLIDEFFNQTSALGAQNTPGMYKNDNLSIVAQNVPMLEGPLYLKSDVKKGWKKHHFAMGPNGLFYCPKEKAKVKEMVCLANFGANEIYVGLNWKKKHKAPTDFCFALKHPRLQQPKCVKYIKFLCAEDKQTLDKWIVAMRIAKYGRQLVYNYHTLTDDLAQEDLDQLAYARSCSVISISQTSIGSAQHSIIESPGMDIQNKTIYSEGSITGSSDVSSGRHSCTSSSSSSGCMSDGPSGNESNAFDSEFSTGTIKRKPSMKPNIPLTSMTRQLKEMVDSVSCSSYSSSGDITPTSSINSSAYTNTGTLTRHSNRRKSVQSNNTDDNSSSSGTLKRHKIKTNRGSIESMSSSQSSNSGSNTPSQLIPFISNGQQSPIYGRGSLPRSIEQENYYDVEKSEILPTTGVLKGYITQQTVVAKNITRQFLPETNISYELNTHNDSNKLNSNTSDRIENIEYLPASLLSQRENKDTKANSKLADESEVILKTTADVHYDSFNDALTDENIQNLPLPPPPSFSNDDIFTYDPMFSSTLSLESLPPPPPELQSLSCYNLSDSQLSLMSLPPPPALNEIETIHCDGRNNYEKSDIITSAEKERLTFNSSRNEIYNNAQQLSLLDQQLSENDRNVVLRKKISSENNSQEILPKPKISFNPINAPGNYSLQNQMSCLSSSVNQYPRSQNININTNNQSNIILPSGSQYNKNHQIGVNNNQHIYQPNDISQIMNAMNINIANDETCVSSGFDFKQTSSPGAVQKPVSLPNRVVNPADIANEEPEVKSPVVRKKQVSFTDTSPNLSKSQKKGTKNSSMYVSPNNDIQHFNTPQNSAKPLPPKRNETTKLSSPKKLSDSSSNPPKEFLKDLQRVMRKKWQVAQKCKLEPATTPHEVLGFREYPILNDDYKETNVSNWVQEHYGHANPVPPNNLYENIIAKQSSEVSEYGSSLYANTGKTSIVPQKEAEGTIQTTTNIKKRPPPPIPKRSENTQLTAVSIQKLH